MLAMKDPSGTALAVGRLGGWEPLGFEAGDNNWYRFVRNSPIIYVDPLGLKWVINRQKDSRADATSDCGDTVEGLSKEIKLSAKEYRKWLKDADGKGLPQSASTKMTTTRRFTVPNTGYIDVSTYTWGFLGWAMIGYKNGLCEKWQSEGLKVVTTYSSTTVSTITGHLQSDDLFKFGYIGHGDRGGSLTGVSNPGSDDDFIVAAQYTTYGIAEMHLIACHSNDGAWAWKSNVSSAGFLRTIKEKGAIVNFWTGAATFEQEPGSR